MRNFSFALAAAALILASAPNNAALAQGSSGERIDKVSNQRLAGSAFASLTGLSYQQCERRCLADPQCKALEHVRGGGTPGKSTSRCRLFSSFGAAQASQGSDIGYKRSTVAKSKVAPPVVKSAPPVARSEPKVTSVPPPPPTSIQQRKILVPPPPVPAPGGPAMEQERRGPAVEEGARRQSSERATQSTREMERRAAAQESARREAAERAAQSERATRRVGSPPGSSPKPDLPVGSAAPAPTEWDVVPVFFGTDRSRRDQAKRIAYGSDRGHKLEVGRALVTVPKAHQVPNVERPWALKIPYTSIILYQEAEDPKKHFTIQELRALSKEDLLALVRDRLRGSRSFQDQALVFVHGYNNGFDDALYRTAQIAYDLKWSAASTPSTSRRSPRTIWP